MDQQLPKTQKMGKQAHSEIFQKIKKNASFLDMKSDINGKKSWCEPNTQTLPNQVVVVDHRDNVKCLDISWARLHSQLSPVYNIKMKRSAHVCFPSI